MIISYYDYRYICISTILFFNLYFSYFLFFSLYCLILDDFFTAFSYYLFWKLYPKLPFSQYSCQKFYNAALNCQSLKAMHFFCSSTTIQDLKNTEIHACLSQFTSYYSVTYFCSLPFCFSPQIKMTYIINVQNYPYIYIFSAHPFFWHLLPSFVIILLQPSGTRLGCPLDRVLLEKSFFFNF